MIKLYQPLLANNEVVQVVPETNKTETKAKNVAVFEKVMMTGFGAKAGLKLSDFIDEKFIEDDMDLID